MVKADSRTLPFPSDHFDVVATDPPYFDNIYYNILADCIYVWKRFALLDVFPDILEPETTNQEQELSASKYRHGGTQEAAAFYTEGMTRALREVHRVLKPTGVLAFVFAHRTIAGWASIVDSFVVASLDMVAAWEMHSKPERRLVPTRLQGASRKWYPYRDQQGSEQTLLSKLRDDPPHVIPRRATAQIA